MGLLDKYLNPVWDKVSQIQPQGIFELSTIICTHQFLRKRLNDEMVDPLDNILLKEAKRFNKKSDGAEVLISDKLKELLIDEIEIGFLCSVRGKVWGKIDFKYLELSLLPDCAGIIALIENNARLGNECTIGLADTGYSREREECRVQIIINWMKLIKIDDPEFVNFISMRYFDKKWRTVLKSFPEEYSESILRETSETLLAKTRKEFIAFSKPCQKFIFPIATGIAKKIYEQNITEQKSQVDKKLSSSDRSRNMPLCFISAKGLQEIVNDVANKTMIVYKDLKIDHYELTRLTRVKKDCPVGILVRTTLLDCYVYAYTVVLSTAVIIQPENFFSCYVDKEFEKHFRDQYGVEIGKNGLSGEEYFQYENNEQATEKPTVGDHWLRVLLQMRKTAGDYSKRLSTNKKPEPITLFDATTVLKHVCCSPTWKNLFTKFSLENEKEIRLKVEKLVEKINWEKVLSREKYVSADLPE